MSGEKRWNIITKEVWFQIGETTSHLLCLQQLFQRNVKWEIKKLFGISSPWMVQVYRSLLFWMQKPGKKLKEI